MIVSYNLCFRISQTSTIIIFLYQGKESIASGGLQLENAVQNRNGIIIVIII